MDKVIGVALPLFALILCGYLARRKQLLNEISTTGLVNVVYYFLLPAFLFTKTLGSTLQHGVDWRLFGSFYGAGALIFGAAAVTGRLLYRHRGNALLVRSLAATFSNTGYMGVPLLILAFGDAAIAPAVTIVVFDSIFVLTGGSILMEIARRSEKSADHVGPGGARVSAAGNQPAAADEGIHRSARQCRHRRRPDRARRDARGARRGRAPRRRPGGHRAEAGGAPGRGVHPGPLRFRSRSARPQGGRDHGGPAGGGEHLHSREPLRAYARESSRIMFLSTAASVFVTSAVLLLLA
jgi:hypothetical protein